MSNAHLKTDAGERVIIIQTYLALLNEGNLSKNEDRTFILASLFRQNKTGIVEDNGMPLNFQMLLKKFGK